MVHGENRNPYWIDRRLTGLAGPEYHAIISFGLPIEPEDSQYGKSWLESFTWRHHAATLSGSGIARLRGKGYSLRVYTDASFNTFNGESVSAGRLRRPMGSCEYDWSSGRGE